MKREAMVRLLAPCAPPCFPDRSTWLSYLESASTEQRDDYHAGPLIFTAGEPVRVRTEVDLSETPAAPLVLIHKGKTVSFNVEMSWCNECRVAFMVSMKEKGRCKPNHLRDLPAPKLKESV